MNPGFLYAAGNPVNHTDPNGTSFFGDFSSALDWAGLAKDVLSGDSAAAYADKVGIITGIGFEAVCGAVAIGGAAATLGVSVGLGVTACGVVSYELAEATKQGTEIAVS
ncbi:hypothetical protein GA0115240_15914 [Streptomyces sp. DvalAA-14]|uniref:hypothetical protein n=1 Tax=unclassified Streptomyces TaxID=2593676 RepID=UPI00081B1732|nr:MULTISPECIES: hypothetical protein [unclassified Streptomyces]MYS24019.1 hypothetical protein [Streptomyces sp. SID4948]SCE41666.1 hypothetical protein GA0115240_15914 [Streptomyces sp. DvalAA-14]